MNIDFSDLEDSATFNKTSEKKQERFPCPSCNGTGKYLGARVHQEKTHCFSCKGKGYFTTSPKARKQAAAKRLDKKLAARKAFTETHKDLIRWVADNVSWNNFAASLDRQLQENKLWSDNQVAAAQRMMDKCEAGRKARQAESKKRETDIGSLARIHELFAAAKDSGIKRPLLRLMDLVLSLAPATGRNAGYLYVKDHGEYAGKISQDGKFSPIRSARPEIAQELSKLAADPLEQAKAHGRRTGSCACCGRELTNSQSIELGIGPICAEKWGL